MAENENNEVFVRAEGTVMAVAQTGQPGLSVTPELLKAAQARGHFTPQEDESIRSRYAGFLATRAALLTSLSALEPSCGKNPRDWEKHIPCFAVALAAAGLLIQKGREVVDWAGQSRLLRKKLDEEDPSRGIPRKTFAALYRGIADPLRLQKFQQGLAFYHDRRDQFVKSVSGDLIAVLDSLDERFAELESSDLWREQLKYRWFSFRRRHHSAWKKTMFGLFEESGSRIADLRQPGIKAANSGKRITADLRKQILEIAKPGDVFITRHDDAMSNLFLPGFWPHAALYLGSESQREAMGLKLPDEISKKMADPICFLEAKKDGVKFRSAEDTLAVDSLVILRPPLSSEEISTGLTRSAGHAGKLYDFVFDFRKSERLVCTEVVYRGYDGCGDLNFKLLETGGRLCLPAEEFISQSLEQGFRVVATCGIGRSEIQKGSAAEAALHASRCGL